MRWWLTILVAAFAFSCVDPAYAVRLKKGCEGVSRANVPNAPRLKKGCKAVYRPNLLYRLTFNDAPPFGTEEDSSSTAACPTRGCAASGGPGTFLAECAAPCVPVPEGDGAFLGQSATGKSQRSWFSKWTGVADTWVRVHVQIVDNSDGNPKILSFRNGAGGDTIGDGYFIRYTNAAANRLLLGCGTFATTTWNSAFVSGTWHEWDVHINTDDRLLDVYVDGATTPAASCDQAGSDSGTEVDGFQFEIEDSIIVLRGDDIRIYDGDPR